MPLLRPLLLAASLLPVLAAPAAACSCRHGMTSAQLDRFATAIFSGRVLSFENGHARVAVIRSIKGDARGTVSVFTATQSTACGVRFVPGDVWSRIRAMGAQGRYSTSRCSYAVGR